MRNVPPSPARLDVRDQVWRAAIGSMAWPGTMSPVAEALDGAESRVGGK